MDSAVHVRRARAGDLGACGMLASAYTGGDPGAWVEKSAALLRPGPHALFVATGGTGSDGVVGYGKVHCFAGPEEPAPGVAPDGFYLSGLVVARSSRHRGAGTALTLARMTWVARRAPCVWYFANAGNVASLRLHEDLGFVEVTRDFTYPGVEFSGGVGVLCRAVLSPSDRLGPGPAPRPSRAAARRSGPGC